MTTEYICVKHETNINFVVSTTKKKSCYTNATNRFLEASVKPLRLKKNAVGALKPPSETVKISTRNFKIM